MFCFCYLQRIATTLQLTVFLSIAIIADIASVDGRPHAVIENDANKEMDEKYYLLRSWGDPMMPFSITYSDYGRTLYETQKQSTTTTSTTTQPPQPSRGSNTPALRRSRKSRNRTRSTNATINKTTPSPPTTTTVKYFSMPLIFTSSNGWGPMGK